MIQPSVSANGRVRRVVTGRDTNGRAVVVADEVVAGDPRALLLWGADTPPQVGDSVAPTLAGWWPPPGGVRVSLSTRAPEDVAAGPRPAHLPEIDDAAGFHASDSVDVVVMISGRLWLELDGGASVELQAGDVLVQNGTRHRWRNWSAEWPLMAVVIVGARGET